jgi:hypothetical protein
MPTRSTARYSDVLSPKTAETNGISGISLMFDAIMPGPHSDIFVGWDPQSHSTVG